MEGIGEGDRDGNGAAVEIDDEGGLSVEEDGMEGGSERTPLLKKERLYFN